MNSSGQAVLVYFMLGIIFFILGIAFAYPLTKTINEATNSTELNCTDLSILSNQDKATCASLDIFPAIFVGAIFGLGGVLLAKLYMT